MQCPKCGGDTWDNRGRKKNPRQPDFKCKDKECDGVIWPPKNGKASSTSQGERPASNHTNGLDERQRAIIRQHSQSMALEVLKLKQMLGELTIADLAPTKLRSLADYFDNDVLKTPQPHRSVEMDEPASDEF